MTSRQYDLVISGAGIAGLSAALLLARSGLKVALIEPFPPKPLKETHPSGRTVALLESSLNILKPCGVWESVQAFASPLRVMRIIDRSSADANRSIDTSFEAQDIGQAQYGFNIPNTILRAALYDEALQEDQIEIFAQTKLLDYEAGESFIAATLENGQTLRASLIVGMDGRGSRVREVAGLDAKFKTYDQTALTFIVNHSRNHNDTAIEFHRPAGPLALVPLPGQQCSVVWVETHARADELMRLKRQEFQSYFQTQTGDVLGDITLETGPESWKLSTMRSEGLIAPRCALAAEAAHVMSPITAQGLNLSLRDVAALCETVIDAARVGLDIGSIPVLRQYEDRRRLDIGTRVRGVDAMNRIVSTDMEWMKGLRRAGWKTLETLPALKQTLTRHGLAPAIDQGRLARGEAL